MPLEEFKTFVKDRLGKSLQGCDPFSIAAVTPNHILEVCRFVCGKLPFLAGLNFYYFEIWENTKKSTVLRTRIISKLNNKY